MKNVINQIAINQVDIDHIDFKLIKIVNKMQTNLRKRKNTTRPSCFCVIFFSKQKSVISWRVFAYKKW